MTSHGWYWLGTGGMLLGGGIIFLIGGNRTKEEGAQRSLHVLVPLISCAFFLAMASGFGIVHLADGRAFVWARWTDWLLCTPLLLLGLAMTGLGEIGRWKTVAATLLAADLYMILTGFAAAVTPPPFKWGFYLLSWGGFLAVYRMLWGPIRREAKRLPPEKTKSYINDLYILSTLWCLYPVFFTLGPDGTKFWSATLTTACITALDLATKVGFGIFSVLGQRKFTTAQRERRPEATVPRGAAPLQVGLPEGSVPQGEPPVLIKDPV